MLATMTEPQKVVGDVLAGIGGLSAALGVVTGLFGALAAIVSFVYGCLRIYEWFEHRNEKKKQNAAR